MDPSAAGTHALRPWSRAWADAACGEHGFYSAREGALLGPSAHFRTSVHVGVVFTAAVLTLLRDVDARLGHPQVLDIVDVGAGSGELLASVLRECDADLGERVRPVAVEVRARPPDLPARIVWVDTSRGEHAPARIRGLLLAHEWLDDVPLEVVEADVEGTPRVVLVDAQGTEWVGPALVDPDDLAWLARWWPVRRSGERAEIGRSRDQAWREWVGRLDAGTALAVDYGHTSEQRARGRYSGGTLTGYRHGRLAAPVPDGTVNITAHVALDSLAHAVGGTLSTQRAALIGLGVDPAPPDRTLASRDPSAYADALVQTSDATELLDPSGLGAFGWVRLDR